MRTKRTLGRRIMADTEVSNEAAELLFEAEDVAELVAEITGEDVTVEADDTEVTFTVAEETYTCSADDADEIINEFAPVEESRKLRRNARRVEASRNIKASKTVKRTARSRK